MNTEKNLNQKILKTITKIQEEYPELTKYLDEMPEDYSASNDVNNKNLKEYYDSLVKLLKSYAVRH